MSSYLMHYGMKRRSGRYPYGSGDNPYQHENRNFLGRIKEYEDSGMNEKDIATAMGLMAWNPKTHQVEGSINLLRERRTQAVNAVKAETMQEVWDHFYKDHMSVKAISEEMHISTGSVRNYIKPAAAERYRQKQVPLNMLRDEVNDKTYVDVGKSANKALGVTDNMLRHTLIPALLNEGYTYEKIQVKQVGTGNMTTTMVLAKPGVTKSEIYKNLGDIMPLGKFTILENGETKLGMKPPVNVDSKRIMINYADTGDGYKKDGLIELRRGVEDICLNKALYAQVRIAVDGTHYLKGMAVYSDDLPDGIDIRFNTSKNSDTPAMGDKDHTVLKPLKDNKENPFGASIIQDKDLKMCQQMYKGSDGQMHQSAINVVTEEGKWDTWSRTIPSQMLSKQDVDLAKKQLNLASAFKKDEFDEICKLTNPTLKKKMLEEFASGCEADAVHLKAAALPRQASKVILPLTTIKETEVYAPGFKDGETVALVRFPHQGIYEIPMLKVNNRNKEAIKMMGKTTTDAIGINYKTGIQLSGADFDGDTVTIIPVKDSRGVKKVNIKSEEYPEELANFDAKAEYKLPEGVKHISARRKNLEMGIVSNLMTDMTLMGAPKDERIRVTKHAMVVIDAEKHGLDIEKSARDNGIAELHLRYQGKAKGGAATIVSKAQSQDYGLEVKDYYKIDPNTGKKLTTETGNKHLVANINFSKMTDEEKLLFNKAQAQYKRTGIVPESVTGSPRLKANKAVNKMTEAEEKAYNKAVETYNKTGKVPAPAEGLVFKEKPTTIRFKDEDNRYKTTKMAKVDDASILMSPNKYPMERVYADYANEMKALANSARKEYVATTNNTKSTSAAKTYASEVSSLMSKLDIAEQNQPRERMAQRAANSEVRAQLQEHPEKKSDPDALKKLNNQALAAARSRFNAKKEPIHISDSEWKAIQASAISPTTLRKIFDNCDSDELKQLATPRKSKTSGLSASKINLMKSMKNSGATLSEISEKLGLSPSTVSAAINGTL